MTFLLAYWKYIAIALVVVAYTGIVYHAGGNGPRAELKTIQDAAIAYKTESARIAKEKDDEYQRNITTVAAAWAAYRLRHPIVETVRVDSRVCEDGAGNSVVSASVGEYISAVGQFRSETQKIIEQCDAQRQQLSCTVDWAGTINR